MPLTNSPTHTQSNAKLSAGRWSCLQTSLMSPQFQRAAFGPSSSKIILSLRSSSLYEKRTRCFHSKHQRTADPGSNQTSYHRSNCQGACPTQQRWPSRTLKERAREARHSTGEKQTGRVRRPESETACTATPSHQHKWNRKEKTVLVVKFKRGQNNTATMPQMQCLHLPKSYEESVPRVPLKTQKYKQSNFV